MNFHPYLVKPLALFLYCNLAKAWVNSLPEAYGNNSGFTNKRDFLSTPSFIHIFFRVNKINSSSLLLSTALLQNADSRKNIVTTTQVSPGANRIFNHLALQIDLEISGNSVDATKCINKII